MTAQLGTTRLADKVIGARTILNTDFPLVAYVERFKSVRGTEWNVALVCNGIAEYSRTYRTRREALEDYESL